MATAPIQVLAHMDPGQDLDDEMFLVLLNTLTQRNLVSCVGVVATLAPAAMRAQLARGTLDELGMRDVRVAAGSDGGSVGKRDFSDVSYLCPPTASGMDGDKLMTEVLTAAEDKAITLVVVASLKDAAALLQSEESLFVRKVREVVIMGGVKPFEAGKLLEPDTAHNNEFDHDASAFIYRRCQELKVPLLIVSRFTANACQMPRSIYDDMAATGSSIGVHLKNSQANSIGQLWVRANAEGEEREGLPARCSKEWFCDTFCAGKGKERDGGQSIWDLIVGFNVYDPIALVAAVPSLAAQFFDFEVCEVNGVGHRVLGISKEKTGLQPDAEFKPFLLQAFLQGIQRRKPRPSQNDGLIADAEMRSLQAELAAAKAENAKMQERIEQLQSASPQPPAADGAATSPEQALAAAVAEAVQLRSAQPVGAIAQALLRPKEDLELSATEYVTKYRLLEVLEAAVTAAWVEAPSTHPREGLPPLPLLAKALLAHQ